MRIACIGYGRDSMGGDAGDDALDDRTGNDYGLGGLDLDTCFN
jgi:hypothetical protein